MTLTQVMLLVLVVALCAILGGARMLYCGHRPRTRAAQERRKGERRGEKKGGNGELFSS